MIEITKDPRDVIKNFKCYKCDCEFTAEFKDAEDLQWIIKVKCPVCGQDLDWTAGEDEGVPKPEPLSPSEYAVTTKNRVIVYSNGDAYSIIGEGTDEERIHIPEYLLRVTDRDLDDVFYPDGTSEWSRMNEPLQKSEENYKD